MSYWIVWKWTPDGFGDYEPVFLCVVEKNSINTREVVVQSAQATYGEGVKIEEVVLMQTHEAVVRRLGVKA